MKNILYVCDFNSIHSRNLIKAVSESTTNNITVLSSYDAAGMEGVTVIPLNQGGFGDKSGLKWIASIILKLSEGLYLFIVTFFLAKRTKRSLSKLSSIEIPNKPDVIHALRTQPEGIIASELNKKYKALFLLTTWGQDFTLWSKLNFWLSSKTKEVLKRVDIVIPDNYRDEKIIKTRFNQANIKSEVLPATGGLNFKFMDALPESDLNIDQNKYNFLTTRGYENSYVKLTKVIDVFEKFYKVNLNSHLYIDLHSTIDETRKEKLCKIISQRGLNDAISLLHLNREEMFQYMSKCMFHVSVTYSDGMPLSLLESLYFGQIPIVADHESTRILEEQFDNYFSFADYKIETIFHAWNRAVEESSSTQSEIKSNNRNALLEHYCRAKNVKKIIRLYETEK